MGKVTYHAIKFPFISKNSLKQKQIFRSMNAVEAVVAIDNTILKKIGIYMEKNASLRRHIRPRLSMLLGQHKRHEIDFAKSSGAQNTVVAVSIIFLIVRAIIERKKSVKVGMAASLGCYCAQKMFNRRPYSSFLDAIHKRGSHHAR